MRAAYATYFEQMIAGSRSARRDLDLVAREIPGAWRSDARLFLLMNIDVMIIAPYLAVRVTTQAAPTPRLDRTPLWEPLLEDLRRIIGLSEDVAAERERRYVSATSVAVALGRLAPRLLTTSFQIWGPDDEDGQPR